MAKLTTRGPGKYAEMARKRKVVGEKQATLGDIVMNVHRGDNGDIVCDYDYPEAGSATKYLLGATPSELT